MRIAVCVLFLAAAVKLAAAEPPKQYETTVTLPTVTPASVTCPCDCPCGSQGACTCANCKCSNCPGLSEQPKNVRLVQVCSGGSCRLVPEGQIQMPATTYYTSTPSAPARGGIVRRIFGGGRRGGGG